MRESIYTHIEKVFCNITYGKLKPKMMRTREGEKMSELERDI